MPSQGLLFVWIQVLKGMLNWLRDVSCENVMGGRCVPFSADVVVAIV